VVDFKNTILIMTSNLGSQYLADPALDEATKEAAVMGVVRKQFRPEFLNRLDEIVMFEPLTMGDLTHIVDIQLERLNKRLAERRISLEVSAAGKQWLATTGFDPVYGARPLKRLVQSTIEDALAKRLLGGGIVDGDTVAFDVAPDGSGLAVQSH
jgi:ATP-dependent Clp protease ATP-binding subunit ClpB